MPKKPDFWKLELGKELERLTRLPNLSNVQEAAVKHLHSGQDLRFLGYSSKGAEFATAEELINHTHIIGTTREGKSKFLEYLVREDIKAGNGVCFIDGSERAETAYSILKFCFAIDHPRVCIIDPWHRWDYDRVALLNPLREDSTANVIDILKALFDVRDLSQINFIQKYLTALVK